MCFSLVLQNKASEVHTLKPSGVLITLRDIHIIILKKKEVFGLIEGHGQGLI